MTQRSIILTLTDAGRAALIDAANQATDVKFSAIALGSGTAALTSTATALTNQKERANIFSASSPAPGQINLSALFNVDPAAQYAATELALIGDNVVFGVWSATDPTQALVVRTPGVPYTCTIAVGYGQLPSQNVSVVIQPLDQAAQLIVNDAISNAMNAHLAAADPHPQYLSGTIDQTGKSADWHKRALDNLGLMKNGLASSGPLNGVNSPNLVFNGSGEFGVTGWYAGNSSGIDTNGLVLKPVLGSYGEGMFWALDRDLDGKVGYFVDYSDFIGVVDGITVSLQAELFAIGLTGGAFYIDAEFYDDASPPKILGQSQQLKATPGTGWTYLSVSFAVPRGTRKLRIRKVLDGNPKGTRGIIACRRIKLEGGGSPSLYSQEASLGYSPAFAAQLGENGYQRLPSGRIEQNGMITSNEAGFADIVFPMQFPVACRGIVATHIGTGPATVIEVYGTRTQNGVRLHIFNTVGASSTWLMNWRAWGE